MLANISKRVDRDARMIDIFDESQWRDVMVVGTDLAPRVTPKQITPTPEAAAALPITAPASSAIGGRRTKAPNS